MINDTEKINGVLVKTSLVEKDIEHLGAKFSKISHQMDTFCDKVHTLTSLVDKLVIRTDEELACRIMTEKTITSVADGMRDVYRSVEDHERRLIELKQVFEKKDKDIKIKIDGHAEELEKLSKTIESQKLFIHAFKTITSGFLKLLGVAVMISGAVFGYDSFIDRNAKIENEQKHMELERLLIERSNNVTSTNTNASADSE